MNGSFNGQILVDKLSKLNNSQQSIETLSHWCIFHRNNAQQVVETWERQFHSSPREQRIPYLYLANDILQNSRRKGQEFINEFWKILPDALADVYSNGGDLGRKTVLRLVDIWEERKVYSSRGQILKDGIFRRKLENRCNSGKSINQNLKQSNRTLLEKIISNYDQIGDEDALFGKCQGAINIVDKIEKEFNGDYGLGSSSGSEVIGELQIQHGVLGECIEQLKVSELSRASLLLNLREALREQEIMVEQVRHQLQAVESSYKRADKISAQFNGEPPATNNRPAESSSGFSSPPPGFAPEATASSTDELQTSVTIITPEEQNNDDKPSTEEQERKTAAAAVAARLTASASSAQMLSLVLSSLASEGMINQANIEDASNSKKPKLECNLPPPQPLLPSPMPPFSQSESLQQLPQLQTPSSVTLPNTSLEPPLSTSVQPATLQPPASALYMNSAFTPMVGVPFSYSLLPPPLPTYPMFGMHPNPSAPNPFYTFQASESSNHIAQPPLPAGPPPMTRQ